MGVTLLREESALLQGFYVPRFEIKIAGASPPSDVLRDVQKVTYRDNLKDVDSFELTVNNWDATARDFKYVGSEKTASGSGGAQGTDREHLFNPGSKEVEVRLGYEERMTLMLKGHFTTLEPTFPSSGAPTLVVRGLNVLHQLRRKQYNTTWGDKKDSEIAENIATLRDGGTKRFPLPIDTDANSKGDEPSLPYVAQKNQYDIDFLLARARVRGYVVVVLEGDPKAERAIARDRRLYFGPSQANQAGLRQVTYELKWGVSLVEFKPTLSTANQVRSVTVQGWDRAARKAIKEKASIDDRKLNVNRDLLEILRSAEAREEIVVDEPVFTAAQARQRAIAILMDRYKDIVKCEGTSVGLPDLRAGQRVQITGIGARFSGIYFVTDTTHTIDDGGYRTRFSARREDDAR